MKQFLLLVQPLREGRMLRVAALPERLELILGLLVLLPEALFPSTILLNLLAQPAYLGLGGSEQTEQKVHLGFLNCRNLNTHALTKCSLESPFLKGGRLAVIDNATQHNWLL